jgi:signal transduction histidine kinase
MMTGAGTRSAAALDRIAAPAPRRAAGASTGLWAVVLLAALAGAALTIAARGDLAAGDLVKNLSNAVAGGAYATLGALIVRRAGNVIGWIMLGEGAGTAFLALASAYAVIGIATFPGTLPAAEEIGTLAECSFAIMNFAIAFMFLLFPTGTLPSRRWRPVAAAGLLLAGLTTAGLVVHPRLVALPVPGGVSLTFPNPLAVNHLGPVLRTVLIGTINGLPVPVAAFLAAAFVSLAVRYRAGGRLLRQQIKWLVLTAVAFATGLLIALLGMAAGQPWLTTVAYTAVALIVLIGIPAAMTIAIVKHRLYEIDVIINRAIRYGLLSAALTAIYVGIVVGIGTLAGYAGGALLNAAAALAIALLFQPLRRRAQLLANRIVYGQRATPYQVLSDFAQDMAGQLDADAALQKMATVLAGATGADRVEVWVRVGRQLRPRVTWPRGSAPPAAVALTDDGALPALAATRAIAVRHTGELLGAITVSKPRNEPVSAAEDKLLDHLASQAGLVLRNAALTAELRATIDDLRASRRRLVQAQDTERQKIERNLHDGAQQQLVALTVQLTLLDDAAEDPAEVREITGQLHGGLRAALEDLRALARGIYPPLLADQGLPAALRAQATRAPLPVHIDADGIGRYPRETEAAVYFCICEALQNTAKYAHASQATIALSSPDSHLHFTVTDDGAGFDTTHTAHGTGLHGMSDRLAAAGGTLHIRSQPGHGTTITGTLPAPDQGDSKKTSLARPASARPEVTRAMREHSPEGWPAATRSAPDLQECP